MPKFFANGVTKQQDLTAFTAQNPNLLVKKQRKKPWKELVISANVQAIKAAIRTLE